MNKEEASIYWMDLWKEVQYKQDLKNAWYVGGYVSGLSHGRSIPGSAVTHDNCEEWWIMGYKDAEGDYGS